MSLTHIFIPPSARPTDNTVLIASRYSPREDSNIIIPEDLHAHVAAVTICGITLLATFCNSSERGASFRRLLIQLANSSEDSLILATGDFYHGAQRSNPGNYEQNFTEVLEAGWIDSFRRTAANPDEWSHRNFNGGYSRPDHLFALREPSASLVKKVWYSQPELIDCTADHAPMLAELRLPTVSSSGA